ncbi:T9SS type A sorting domain-containing protein [Winogradskyella sp. DF17]|uniref:T9SS type A sorting domain-containing protein n=2 Tax=Winogradskyella pelagia TaxID=2819984 RepID=A0ABS3T3P8_9FLAO|nr:T9SS type A sorting domain-containing protein [Winogradskyella sp. DF17]
MTADLSWLEQGISAVSYNVEVYASGQSAANGDTPVFADAAVVGLSVTATGLMEATDYDAFITTSCSGATANSALIGPVAFTTSAACGDVSGLGTDNLVSDSVDVTFTAGNNNDVFLVEVYLGGQSAANGDTPVFSDAAVVASPVSVTGLTPETAYDAFVTGSCGATATALQGPQSFTTPAAPPANDDFVNAAPVACDDVVNGSTSNATLDEDDAPDCCGADLDAPNTWYSYDSAVQGAADVTVSLCGSAYDTAILIYTGTSGNLTAVAGNDDFCDLQSEATFAADGVQTYYITVTGWNPASTGDYTLTVSCVAAVPPPANDDCASAEALTIGQETVGTTAGATQNPAEEQPSCDTFGTIADVWYTVTTTDPGDLSIVTAITGTSDQANVAVYTACGGLQADEIECVDGNGGETVTLNGLAAGTYYIRVWSDGAAPPSAPETEGTFTITAGFTLSNGQDLDNPSEFSYYPNPVSSTLSLNASLNNIQDVTIFNMLGQRVLSSKPNALNSEVDMSGLQTGTYFIQVTVNNNIETIRVIKQ